MVMINVATKDCLKRTLIASKLNSLKIIIITGILKLGVQIIRQKKYSPIKGEIC